MHLCNMKPYPNRQADRKEVDQRTIILIFESKAKLKYLRT